MGRPACRRDERCGGLGRITTVLGESRCGRPSSPGDVDAVPPRRPALSRRDWYLLTTSIVLDREAMRDQASTDAVSMVAAAFVAASVRWRRS